MGDLLRAEVERVVGPLADQMLDELVNGTDPKVVARGHAKRQTILVVDIQDRPKLKTLHEFLLGLSADEVMLVPPGFEQGDPDAHLSVIRELQGYSDLEPAVDGYEFREDRRLCQRHWWPTEEALRLQRMREDLDSVLPPELRSTPSAKPNRAQRRARRGRRK